MFQACATTTAAPAAPTKAAPAAADNDDDTPLNKLPPRSAKPMKAGRTASDAIAEETAKTAADVMEVDAKTADVLETDEALLQTYNESRQNKKKPRTAPPPPAAAEAPPAAAEAPPPAPADEEEQLSPEEIAMLDRIDAGMEPTTTQAATGGEKTEPGSPYGWSSNVAERVLAGNGEGDRARMTMSPHTPKSSTPATYSSTSPAWPKKEELDAAGNIIPTGRFDPAAETGSPSVPSSPCYCPTSPPEKVPDTPQKPLADQEPPAGWYPALQAKFNSSQDIRDATRDATHDMKCNAQCAADERLFDVACTARDIVVAEACDLGRELRSKGITAVMTRAVEAAADYMKTKLEASPGARFDADELIRVGVGRARPTIDAVLADAPALRYPVKTLGTSELGLEAQNPAERTVAVLAMARASRIMGDMVKPLQHILHVVQMKHAARLAINGAIWASREAGHAGEKETPKHHRCTQAGLDAADPTIWEFIREARIMYRQRKSLQLAAYRIMGDAEGCARVERELAVMESTLWDAAREVYAERYAKFLEWDQRREAEVEAKVEAAMTVEAAKAAGAALDAMAAGEEANEVDMEKGAVQSAMNKAVLAALTRGDDAGLSLEAGIGAAMAAGRRAAREAIERQAAGAAGVQALIGEAMATGAAAVAAAEALAGAPLSAAEGIRVAMAAAAAGAAAPMTLLTPSHALRAPAATAAPCSIATELSDVIRSIQANLEPEAEARKAVAAYAEAVNAAEAAADAADAAEDAGCVVDAARVIRAKADLAAARTAAHAAVEAAKARYPRLQIAFPPVEYMCRNPIRQAAQLRQEKVAPDVDWGAMIEATVEGKGWGKLHLTASPAGAEGRDVRRLVCYLKDGKALVAFQRVNFWSNHGASGAPTHVAQTAAEGKELAFPFSETHFKLLCLTEFLRQNPEELAFYARKFKEIMELDCPVKTMQATAPKNMVDEAGRAMTLDGAKWDAISMDAMRTAVLHKAAHRFAEVKRVVTDLQARGATEVYVVECGDNPTWSALSFIHDFEAKVEAECPDLSRASIEGLLKTHFAGKNQLGQVWTEALLLAEHSPSAEAFKKAMGFDQPLFSTQGIVYKTVATAAEDKEVAAAVSAALADAGVGGLSVFIVEKAEEDTAMADAPAGPAAGAGGLKRTISGAADGN
jgi:hypothetical protein